MNIMPKTETEISLTSREEQSNIGERMAEIRNQKIGRKENRKGRKEYLAQERVEDSEDKRKRKIEQNRVENREENRIEQNRIEQNRIEQNRIEQRRNEGEEGSENCHLEGRR